MAKAKRRAKQKVPACRRCDATGVPLIGRFCPTCAALVDRAQRVERAKLGSPNPNPPNKRKRMNITPEDRKRRGDQMRAYWQRVREGKAPKPQPYAPRTIQMALTGEIPADIMAELEGKARVEAPKRGEPIDATSVVARELAARELARRKLLRFIVRMNPKYKAGWFHIDLCERLERFLEACARGESPRLMLFVPPRAGKSKIVSEEFPPWSFGKYPDFEFIATSYGAELARDFSYKVQERIRSPEYEQVFPDTRLRPGKESIDSWRLEKGAGMYIAAGVGGPLTGRGAHCLIIDDPFKNREDADSQLNRDGVYKWYTSTAYTRLMPGGGVLLIQTRWHDDDLAGRLLNEMAVAEKQFADTGVWPEDADRWEVVSYPAIAVEDEKHRKRGEALHPDRYPLSALLKIKRTLGPRDWSALYQQNPVPDEGGFFSKDHIRFYDTAPDTATLQIYATGDLAISKKEHADHTVFLVGGVDKHGDILVLDIVRGRFDSMEIIDNIIDIQRRWRPKLWGMEEGQITTAIGPFLEKRMQEERMSIPIEPMKIRRQDKEARARPIQGRMRQGKVLLARNAPWTPHLLTELMKFPNSNVDDCVDALAWLGQMLMLMHVNEPAAQKIPSWRDKLNQALSNHSSTTSAMAA